MAGAPLDTLWLLDALILAYAAWQPDARPTRAAHSLTALLAGPVIAGIAAIVAAQAESESEPCCSRFGDEHPASEATADPTMTAPYERFPVP